MLYNIKFSHRNTCKKFALGIFLLINAIAPASATTSANYAEMGAALATMAVDIAANHYAFNGNTKKANLFKCSTDLLSLTTKGFFFYNNVQAKTFSDIEWSLYARDCQAHTILMARDVTKLAEHLYTSIATKNNVDHEPLDFEALTAALALENLNETTGFAVDGAQELVDQADTPEQDSRTLEYARKVILLPALKGLTALAVACTQGYATSYASHQARFTATAAHSFAQLLEEHSNLDQDSAMNNPLLFALCLNAAWIIYEGNQYRIEQNNIQGQTRQGRCPQCGQAGSLKVLGCAHAYCTNCLNRHVQAGIDNNPTQLHQLRCPHVGCNHAEGMMTRNDVIDVMDNAPQAVRAFDLAAFNDAPEPFRPRPFVPLSAEAKNLFRAPAGPHGAPANACQLCGAEDDVHMLGCKHMYCVDCLQGIMRAQFNDNGPDFDAIRCPHVNGSRNARCRHCFTRNEVACFSARLSTPAAHNVLAMPGEQAMLERYDQAVHDKAINAARAERTATKQRAKTLAMMRLTDPTLKPCPACGAAVSKTMACDHMHCRCGADFCYQCGANYRNGGRSCNYPNCVEPLGGQPIAPVARARPVPGAAPLVSPIFPPAAPVAPARGFLGGLAPVAPARPNFYIPDGRGGRVINPDSDILTMIELFAERANPQ